MILGGDMMRLLLLLFLLLLLLSLLPTSFLSGMKLGLHKHVGEVDRILGHLSLIGV